MSQSEKTRYLILTALFAAIIYVGTRINIPLGINNRIIHVGDAMIYIAACILPMPYAMASGAIGAGFADFTTPGCIIWVVPTMLIKPLLVIFFSSKQSCFVCKRSWFGIIGAGITGLVGYVIAEGIIYGNVWAALVGLPADALQPLGSGILFIALGCIFDRMKLKQLLNKQIRGNA